MKHPTQGFQPPAPWTRAGTRPKPREQLSPGMRAVPLAQCEECLAAFGHAPACPAAHRAAGEAPRAPAEPPTPEPSVPPAGEEMPAGWSFRERVIISPCASDIERWIRGCGQFAVWPSATNGGRWCVARRADNDSGWLRDADFGYHATARAAALYVDARLAEQDAPKAVPTAAKPGEALRPGWLDGGPFAGSGSRHYALYGHALEYGAVFRWAADARWCWRLRTGPNSAPQFNTAEAAMEHVERVSGWRPPASTPSAPARPETAAECTCQRLPYVRDPACAFHNLPSACAPAPRAAASAPTGAVDAVRAFLAHPRCHDVSPVRKDRFVARYTEDFDGALYLRECRGDTPDAACEAALRALGADQGGA